MENYPNAAEYPYHFFGRHLVALQGAYEELDLEGKPTGRMETFIYSGFIISLKGLWILVTAGHILRSLEESRNHRQIHFLGFALVDYFGPEASHHQPVPFLYNDAPKYYVFDGEMGLDFGLIVLSDYYQRLLETNNVVPFTENDWISPFSTEFDFYLLIGLPEHLVETRISTSNKTAPELKMSFQSAVVTAKKLSDPPEGMDKPYPRFFAKLNGIEPLLSIKGMSGGPILGLTPVDDRHKYWVVAVQSGWLPESQIIIGCPIELFMDQVMTALESKSSS